MKEVKIVIGANFGDEGKGQMTEYFADQAIKKNESCLVVCHNGSAQKGHTCVSSDGSRHVFHHFGSGTFVGAETYLSEEYIVNPIFFRTEYEELKKRGYDPKVFVNTKCRIAIPADIMLNQEIETNRGKERHGSCGYGFFEAVTRNKESEFQTTIENLSDLKKFKVKMKKIVSQYTPLRWASLHMNTMRREFNDLISDELIMDAFIDDLKFFLEHTIQSSDQVLKDYDCVIFEGSQGLLLDEDNIEYFPHLTPSHTGLCNPYKILKRLSADCPIEVCYVTRTYLTRHGAGRLDGECRKEDINPDMVDLTNVPNEFQESLRYAKLDVEDLKYRIFHDFEIAKSEPNYEYSIAVMHENEYSLHLLDGEKYHSEGPTKNDIICN